MARAKRFDRDRAEARRRYRATLAPGDAPSSESEDGAEASAGQAAVTPAPAPRRPSARPAGSGSRQGAQPMAPRMGIVQAARSSYRRVDIRKDLSQLPSLIVHRATWAPILLSLLSIIVFAVTGPTNTLTSFAFNIFGLPPAMAAVFIAGFFAPTAAWLLGGIVGLAVSVFYSGFVVVAAQGSVPDVPAVGSDQIPSMILNAFIIGPLYGVVLGAAAAWYKRFLYLSSPSRPPTRPASNGNRKPRASAGRTGTRSR